MGSFPSRSALSKTRAEKARYLGPNVYALSKAQARLGLDLHVLCRGARSRETIDQIKVHRLPPPYNLTALIEMLRINSSAQIDVIHTHAANAYTIAVSSQLLDQVPIVVHVHGTTIGASAVREEGGVPASWSRTVSIARERFLWTRAQRLIAVSENIRDELVSGYRVNPTRVRVVHNGVDSSLFRPSKLRQELRKAHGWGDRRVILYVGQLSPRKGLPFLINATRLVANRIGDVKVVLVGGVPRYQEASTHDYVSFLRHYAASLGVDKIVEFLGSVPNSELPEVYSAADIFVLPSLYEGLPKAMLEAMACEKPCVVTDLPGMAAVLTDDLGIRVPPRDADGLAAALVSLLESESSRVDMGKRAREKVVRELTWEAAAREIQVIYSEIT